MSNIFLNNKIIATIVFLGLNLISIVLYSLGLLEKVDDIFYRKICEFFYIFNFLSILLLFKFFKVSLFSPQGLFYISCCLFSLGRVFLSFFNLYDNYYELYWGQLFLFNVDDFYSSLIFWQTSVSAFIFGSLLISTTKKFSIDFTNADLKRTFKFMAVFLLFILFILWFPISISLVGTFIHSGYEGLYEGQTEYNFSYQRLASLLLPVMVAAGVLCGNKKILYGVYFILFLYIFVNLAVGQRALLFVWVLIGLWLYNLITKKNLPYFRILVVGIGLMVFAQFLESFRGGRSDFGTENPLTKFIYVQSLTYILPSIVESIDSNWPPLAYITMIFPVAGIFSLLGLVHGTQNFSSGAFFAYSLNPSLFENGFGLGWSVFLDLYILGGRNYIVLSILSFLLGLLFCYFVEKAKKNIIALYLLLSTIPAFMFAPRSLMYSISSGLIYAAIIFVVFYFILIFLKRNG